MVVLISARLRRKYFLEYEKAFEEGRHFASSEDYLAAELEETRKRLDEALKAMPYFLRSAVLRKWRDND